jgi:hypothetical protein
VPAPGDKWSAARPRARGARAVLWALALLATGATRAGAARSLYVTPTGAGARDASSWGNASGSLQECLDRLRPGDTLWIGGGTYAVASELSATTAGTAAVRITISTSHDPVYGGRAVLDGKNAAYSLLDIDASWYTIRGIDASRPLVFYNAKRDHGWNGRGFLELEGDGFLVERCHFFYDDYQMGNDPRSNARASGITLGLHGGRRGAPTSRVEIRNCLFHHLAYGKDLMRGPMGKGGGVYAANASEVSFHHNEVYRTFNGLHLEGPIRGWDIHDNVMHDNINRSIAAEQQGVRAPCNDVRIHDNILYNDYVGAITVYRAVGDGACHRWQIYRNIAYQEPDRTDMQDFVLMVGLSDSQLYNNVIYNLHTTRFGGVGGAFRLLSEGGVRNDHNLIANNTYVDESTAGDINSVDFHPGAGRDNRVVNNLIYAANPRAHVWAVRTRSALTQDELFESNFYYLPPGRPAFLIDGRDLTFAEWQTTSRDREGGLLPRSPFRDVAEKPSVGTPQASGLAPTAPELRNRGLDLSSVFTTDFLGKPRRDGFGIGAYEF